MSAINNLPGLAKFNNATHEVDGLMSRNDKQKLDSLHKSVTIHATLYAAEWSANRPYTQTIELLDITPDTNGSLTIDPLATDEQLEACVNADIIIADQAINYITLQVTGEKPEIDIPVVIVFGENLAVITPPTIVDTGNHVHNIIIQPNDWVSYLDTYKTILHIPGINESVVGSVSMKSGISEIEAYTAARARIEVLDVYDDTVELILRGEKPNIPLHIVFFYGPSIAIVRRPVFGGKITPQAQYQEFDDSITGLGVTNTQSAIEALVTGTTGMVNKPTHFKTIAVMKEAMNLRVGQLVQTSGYRTENDGGGATYIITSDSSKVDNGGSVHVLKNGLRAEIVLALGEDINLKCFGLYGDEIHDDTPAFKRGFELCKQLKGGTVRWQGIAALSEPLVIDSHYINLQGYGYGSTLKANFERDYVLAVSYEPFSTTEEIQQILIGNFRINGNNKTKYGLVVDNNLPVYNSIIENIHISNTEDYALVANNCKNIQFNMITTETTYGGIKLIGAVANTSFTNCEVKESAINEPLKITVEEGSEDRASMVQFNSCYFGDSEVESLVNIERSIDVDFNKCIFDLKQIMDTSEYAIIIGEYALYTRFIDCFLNGLDKTCGIFKNEGPDTEIKNFKGVDIKSQIHVLSVNTIHISDLILVGDSTPLIIHTTNENKTILDIDSVINTVNDDTMVFPSNANYYNIYMNQKDEVGIKGKLNNYILDKHLENELIEIAYTKQSTTLEEKIKLPAEGIWEVDILLNLNNGSQGKVLRYQVAFKKNSTYSVANIQEFTKPVSWGNSTVETTTPTIDKYGNLTINFTTNTSNLIWDFKLKARLVIGF